MDHRRTVSPETALASDIFDKFCGANTLKGILNQYRQLCCVLRIKPTHFPDFYPRLRTKLSSWRAQGLWSKFEKRASQKCYGRGKICYGSRVLIIGGGPCGLRAAIEAQLLGAKVVLVEKRDRFSRNNVLHLWPFVIADLKALGAKKFYGKFCAGSIDHISIRQIQCILLKVALLLGVEVHEGVGFEGLREPTENEGWRAVISPADHPVCHYTFDVLIGADGRRNTLDGFKRKALRAKLAIAITANFINKHTEGEARVKEISGVSYIFNQKFFQDLCAATGIDLENIVYYKDETHYFVMTAKKQSLLMKGVLKQDFADTAKLLSHENIDSEALMLYALEAAMFATEYQLPDIEFAVNHYGQPDVAMFDFTAMYAAENACRVVQRKSQKLLMTLVGDSLLEPFWPTGSGCARGFLSSFDACWMLRSWTCGVKSVLEVIAERESIYRLLGQTTPENLQKEHIAYTIDPHTRYPNLNLRLVMPFQIKSLYESDEKIPEVSDALSDLPLESDKVPKKRRRDSIIAVDSLLSWLRDQVSCYSLEVNDVKDAFARGDVICAIVHRFRPDLIEFPLPNEENVDPSITAAFQNQLAFDILHQEYGLPHAMSGYDSVQLVSADFLTLVAYLSQIYEIFRGEIPQTKYLRSDSGDELEDQQARHNHLVTLKDIRMAVTAKHHFPQKSVGRRSRLSSGKESREGESEQYRRHKKRKSEEKNRPGSGGETTRDPISYKKGTKECRKIQDRILDAERFMRSMRLLQLNQRSVDEEENGDEAFHDISFHLYRQTVPDFDDRCKFLEKKLAGREVRTVFGKSIGGDSQSDSDKMVPGMAKDLEAKLRGRQVDKQKPKDLIRAIGKIEKSDWNIQLIEKKIAEIKDHATSKKDRDNKVPKWSREAFDDKREAMKRKMEGGSLINEKEADKALLFDETMKKLGNKLKEGNALDVGQRGCNKVSAMAEQLIHKLERPHQYEVASSKPSQTTRAVFELPKKDRIDLCHFCKERVYVVERMTAEGKFFHRNCFRCEYCNTSLRIGSYVYDREARYGERFYCAPHYATVRMYGWKKFEADRQEESGSQKFGEEIQKLLPQQILSEMDARGTTPERVEFENSFDLASDDDLQMDEDEWTDRNFGASNADNTSDEASDLSDDEEVTPEGNKDGENNAFPNPTIEATELDGVHPFKKETESSDSDTEVASEEESGEDASGEEGSYEEEDQGEEEDEDEDDEYEEECGGSTTEIETDSEFAEDPPHSVPGSIPTIVVDAPEQLMTKMVDAASVNYAKSSQSKKDKSRPYAGGHSNNNPRKIESVFDAHNGQHIELVKKGAPERQLPVVTSVPRKWEPLSNNPVASKLSLELKKKYLHGSSITPLGLNYKKPTDPEAQNQFRSVLDMISEQQKLLQPASKPSAAMQAFLEGAEKLKHQQAISPGNRSLVPVQAYNLHHEVDLEEQNTNKLDNSQLNSSSPLKLKDEADLSIDYIENYEKVLSNGPSGSSKAMVKNASIEKIDKHSLELQDQPNDILARQADSSALGANDVMMTSDTFSASQSETETRSTVVNAVDHNVMSHPEILSKEKGSSEDENADSGSDTEVGSGEILSDLDDIDFDIDPCSPHILMDPPRVEIEDEFGVTQAMDSPRDTADVLKVTTSMENLDTRLPSSLGSRPTSSSDSSLNSGNFLETEISDYVKDEEHANLKKKGSKVHNRPNKQVNKLVNYDGRPDIGVNHEDFDLDSLDFADIDGSSSPDEVISNKANALENIPVERHLPNHELIGSPNASQLKKTDDPPLSKSDARTYELIRKAPEEFPSLERVGPFSGARDSLDYRKVKSGTNNVKNKELYSTYSVPSNKGQHSPPEKGKVTYQDLSVSNKIPEEDKYVHHDLPTSSDDSIKSGTSPGTARRLHQIHQDRVKQNDLIRSMVLGRIKKSPDKVTSRKNSKGSSSFHSDTPLEKSSDELNSPKSSDTSLCQDESTSDEYQSGLMKDITRNENKVSSSEASSVNEIPHRPMAESGSNSNSSDESSLCKEARELLTSQPKKHGYEPVFTSSPRFRNRRKFEMSSYQSATEPSTPTNYIDYPMASLDVFKVAPVEVNDSSKSSQLHQSMPDLINRIASSRKLHDFHGPPQPGSETPEIDSNYCQTKKNGGPYANNPFLATSTVSSNASDQHPDSSFVAGRKRSQDDAAPLDDFISLHLRLKAKNLPSERRTSPEKSRSVCTESLKDYCDSGYYQSASNCDSSMTHSSYGDSPVAVNNWMFSRYESTGRPRANTLADINLDPSSTYPAMNFSSNRVHNENRSLDNAEGNKSSKGRALSSATLLDSTILSDSTGRGMSFPDICSKDETNDTGNCRKGKDRDRRRSLIQTVSDFFRGSTSSPNEKINSSGGQSSLTNSTSSSSIVSPTKEKFSIFNKLLSNKDKKSSSKSKESILSPTSSGFKYENETFNDRNYKNFSAKRDSEPNMVIHQLTSSPNPSKPERPGQPEPSHNFDIDILPQNMATLSIVTSTKDSRKSSNQGRRDSGTQRNRIKRSREIEEIQLTLESLEADQRSLESRGISIEKKLRGEEIDEANRTDDDIMEEWFQLVREKTRLQRFEKELLVRAQELELEARKEQLQEKLDELRKEKSLNDKKREIEIINELRHIEEQHNILLNSIHTDMEKYNNEDVSFTFSPSTSRLESDV